MKSREHPTSNIEHSTSNDGPRAGRWMFDVGSWMLVVFRRLFASNRQLFCLGIFALFLAQTSCTTKSKANARARAAYTAGQQQVINQMTEARRTSIRFFGPVRQTEVAWQEGLTLSQAIAAAGYTDRRDPNIIWIIRQRERVAVSPRDLLAGRDVPLEPGDTVEMHP